jgi:hypothetical protein
MLTQWVEQTWRELHLQNSQLIQQTFRKLGLSLAVNKSKDDEFWIKNVPNVKVSDWTLQDNQKKKKMKMKNLNNANEMEMVEKKIQMLKMKSTNTFWKSPKMKKWEKMNMILMMNSMKNRNMRKILDFLCRLIRILNTVGRIRFYRGTPPQRLKKSKLNRVL